MFLIPLRFMFLTCLIFAPVFSIQAQDSENIKKATEYTEQLTGTILSIVNDSALPQDSKTTQLKAIIRKNISTKVPALVLGAPYRGLSPEERERYNRAFLAFTEFSVATRLTLIEQGSLTITKAFPVKRGAVVEMIAQIPDQEPIPVSFRLIDENGDFRVLDIVFTNLSLIATQKAEITAIFSTQGFDGLIALLEKRTS
jgi:ABC-type transporter MlaC component